jgi:class 3 adenylate cyclase/CheY-like chemotaxis protein
MNHHSTDLKTILVVTPDSHARDVLWRLIFNEGYKADAAWRGEECLLLALQKDYDGFIIDWNLPDVAALDVCRRLRMIDKYRLAPIILLSDADRDSQLEDILAAGGDDFIVKPLDQLKLRARLASHMQRVEYFNQLQLVQRNYGRYINPRTKKMLSIYSATGVMPLPRKLEICILFSDVRGFTALSQELPAKALFYTLSRNLEMQVENVYRCGGYVEKFAGDGIMAIFDKGDKASRACRCALDIMDANRAAQEDQASRILQLGIGIHQGEVLVGNIGTEERLEYAAIGSTVNVAARLCGLADPLSVVTSETVARAAAGDATLEFSGNRELHIKGIEQPVRVYDLHRRASGSDKVTEIARASQRKHRQQP